MKWFQMVFIRVWYGIVYKYEFDLVFGQLDSLGFLKIKFCLGKFMFFNLIFVIQCDDLDLYFVFYFFREFFEGILVFSIDWFLFFVVYEWYFFRMILKVLFEGVCYFSCLQIVFFLFFKQSCLIGFSGFSSYYLKMVLLYFLFFWQVVDWKVGQLDVCLYELFCFLEKSLLEKKFYYFFIGNCKVFEVMGFLEVVFRVEFFNFFWFFVL